MSQDLYTYERIGNCKNCVYIYRQGGEIKEIVKFLPFLHDALNGQSISEGLCYETLHYRFLMKVTNWGVVPTDTLEPDIMNELQRQNRQTFKCVQILKLEFCTGGNLRAFTDEYLRKLPQPSNSLQTVPTLSEEFQKIIFVTSVLGLQYIHKYLYVHSDIKPPNILIRKLIKSETDYTIEAVIGDFGSMQHLPYGKTSVTAIEVTPFLYYFLFI